MIPVPRAVHLPGEIVMAAMRGEPAAERLAALDRDAGATLDELVRWADLLRGARVQAAGAERHSARAT